MLEHDIVIVGAGLSGLAAAQRLSMLFPRPKICVLEARDRVGGRTHTLAEEGIDVGAQWIGPEHREMLKLADAFGLDLIEQYYPAAQGTSLVECVGYQSTPLSETDSADIERYMYLVESLSNDIDLDCPWSHPTAKNWDKLSLKSHVEDILSSIEARREVLLFAQTVLACDPESVSFLSFLFYIKSGGGMVALGDGDQGAQRWRVRGGMQQISTRLCEELKLRGVEIKLNFPVRRCTLGLDGKAVLQSDDDSSSHDSVSARHVIWALPPQLLSRLVNFDQRVLNAFPIITEKITLGRRMSCGHAVKVVIAFERAFWLAEGKNSPASNRKHFSQLGYLHNVFDSQLSNGTPALVGLVTGVAAKDFSKMNPEARKAAVVKQLVAMYQPDAFVGSPDPVFYVDKVWMEEEFSGGCFAGICPPGDTLSTLGRSWRISTGPFYFCSTEGSTQFYGYMEGAVLAGFRAAQECADSILDC